MSMHPQAIAPIPEEAACVARAALPRSNTYLLTMLRGYTPWCAYGA
ncbi:MAG: hypothetical protein NVS4B11_36640 [Ktedonobacteraceae bacterium]